MVHPEIGEISILEDGRAVQVVGKLGYGLFLCWVDRGNGDEELAILNIVDLYRRTHILKTRPSGQPPSNFDLN